MYQESVVASTNPNRVTWVSGSVNVPGSPQTKDEGGYPYIDNNETPGCETGGFNCYPLSWKTAPEFYEDAGVSWSIFQDADNFDDNPLAWFSQFQDAATGSDLKNRGMVGSSLDEFYALAANGTLPAISYIIAPTELSEHPPYAPRDGAWIQKQVIDAVTQGKGYNSSVVIISYDETGGWGDHVVPYQSPNGTAGEWLNDPYDLVGYTASGPGFRLPFYIVSPWTRNGNVFTEHADHNSQIMFIEEWLAAKGKNVTTNQMNPWRRQHMSSLLNAFDFANPDYSLPTIPDAPAPHKNSQGDYDGAPYCEGLYPTTRPTVPYTNQTSNVASLSEQGFKEMRGALTEGRYVVLEMNGYALTNTGGNATDFSASPTTSDHSDLSQRWVFHAQEVGGDTFTAASAVDGKYISSDIPGSNESDGLEVFTVSFQASSGYALRQENGTYVAIDGSGAVGSVDAISYFKAFSVTYS
jgi:phospholipase C